MGECNTREKVSCSQARSLRYHSLRLAWVVVLDQGQPQKVLVSNVISTYRNVVVVLVTCFSLPFPFLVSFLFFLFAALTVIVETLLIFL